MARSRDSRVAHASGVSSDVAGAHGEIGTTVSTSQELSASGSRPPATGGVLNDETEDVWGRWQFLTTFGTTDDI